MKNLEFYLGKTCNITMIDGSGGIGKVIRIEKDPDGSEWLIVDYGYGFRIDSIKSIEIIKHN